MLYGVVVELNLGIAVDAAQRIDAEIEARKEVAAIIADQLNGWNVVIGNVTVVEVPTE